MSQAIESLFLVVKQIMNFINILFSRIYSGGFNIFDIPFYMWILIFLVVGFFLDIFKELVE